MKKKGYIFTVSAFFLLASVLLLALFFASRSDSVDITGPKLAALYDDVRGDVYELLGLSVSVQHEGGVITVSFNDTIPSATAYPWLKNYEAYIERNYTGMVAEPVEDRHGSLAAADISMDLENTSIYIDPYNYTYAYNNLSKNNVSVYPGNESPSLLEYNLSIMLDQNISSSTANVSPGSLPVTLNVTGGTFAYYRRILASNTNLSNWTFETPNGSLSVRVGSLSLGDMNRTSALAISADNVSARAITSLSFNQTSPVTVESGFVVTIEDIMGDAELTNKIWFIKG